MNTSINLWLDLRVNTTSRNWFIYEETNDVQVALAREKQIKGWLRAKKITLIESMNLEWKDLSLEWYI